MALHQCPDCGLTHDHAGETPVSDAVRIAELETKRDIEVARLAKSESREWNETMVEETKIEAAAAVEVAEVQAEAIAEVIAAEGEASVEEGEPVIVTVPDEPEGEPEPDAVPPPEAVGGSPGPAKKSLWPYG